MLLFPCDAFAQRMGHSNNSAPNVSQKIEFGDKSMELTYTSITWANGQWKAALDNSATRDGMRSRVNRSAESSPLGTFRSPLDLTIGGTNVAAGEYRLAFVIGDSFQWQLSLSNEVASHVVDVNLKPSGLTLDRLVLSLYPMSDKGDAAIWIGFGAEGAILPLTASVAASDETMKVDTINRTCPLMDQAVDPEYVVTYKGKRVGLCCEECVPDWNELADEEKQKLVARWMK